MTEQEMLDESFRQQREWMADNPDITRADSEAILAEWGYIKMSPIDHKRNELQLTFFKAWRKDNQAISDEQEACEFWCLLNDLY